MRRFLLRTVLLFGAGALLLWIRPKDLELVATDSPFFTPVFSDVFAVLFGTTAMLALLAAYVRRAVLQPVAVVFGFGTSVFWTLIVIINALAYDGDIGRPVLWIVLTLSFYEALPYATITTEQEQDVGRLIENMRRTQASLERRVERNQEKLREAGLQSRVDN